MVVRKLSVFLLVIAFHVVVLGVVYMATRTDDPSKAEEPPKEEVDKGVTKKDEPPKKDVGDKPPKKEDPPTQVSKYSYVFHTVAKGDFLGKIATKYKVSSKEIMTANNLKDPNKIFLGQKLKIPVSKQ